MGRRRSEITSGREQTFTLHSSELHYLRKLIESDDSDKIHIIDKINTFDTKLFSKSLSTVK